MANREALRELQARLVNRLQAAKKEALSVSSWLAIESGRQFYLLPLGHSGEIFPWRAIQTVPYTNEWFLGVANLRGGLVGVIDLAILLGSISTAIKPTARTEQMLMDSSLLALNTALEVNAALLVDRLMGLRGIDAFASFEQAPSGAPSFFGMVYLDANGTRWQELNLQLLAQHPLFLSISA